MIAGDGIGIRGGLPERLGPGGVWRDICQCHAGQHGDEQGGRGQMAQGCGYSVHASVMGVFAGVYQEMLCGCGAGSAGDCVWGGAQDLPGRSGWERDGLGLYRATYRTGKS